MGTMLLASSPDSVFPRDFLSPIDDVQDINDYSGIVVGDYDFRVRLDRALSSGTFGQVYYGTIVDGTIGSAELDRRVAVKIEPKYGPAQLLHEGSIYRKLEGGPGIANLLWFGMNARHDINVMVCSLLGQSLYEKYVLCGQKLSLHTGLQLIDQMLTTLNYIHDMGIVHRDISPNNWLMGNPDGPHADRLYLVDFGLSKKFKNGPCFMPPSHRNRDFRVTRPVVGTMRFASVPSHRGEPASRRDDMEALGYLMIYLLKGRLPWQGLKAETPIEKFSLIAESKCSISPDDLCIGLPKEFSSYIDYTRSLRQYDIPDYQSIKVIFQSLSERNGFSYNYIYDWDELNSKKAWIKNICTRNTSGDSGIADMFNLSL